MMNVAIAIFAILSGMALIQAIFAILFVRLFYRPRPDSVPDDALPSAAILLSLRGADPHLAHGLRQLMAQDYPLYELRIVVDREGDPAWDVVQRAVGETGFQRVHVSPLRQRRDTCSLKNSALVQLASELEPSCEVVVLADADLVSHSGWLRELVSPLADPRVGAAYGNRWFWPRRAPWGALVRYLWNAAAVVPMHLFKIPWGGTFAIRARVLRDSGLLEKWSRSVVEDAPVRTALAEHGLDLRFVPSLMMVNREECGLPFSLDFVKRQMTWTKIYHPRWAPVVVHALATTGILTLAAGLSLAGVAIGDARVAAVSAAALLLYGGAMLALLAMIEAGVRRVIRLRGESPHRFTVREWLKIAAAIPLTQGVYLLSVLLAMFRKQVAWRGVTYHVRGPWDIRMVRYQPYEQAAAPADANTSL